MPVLGRLITACIPCHAVRTTCVKILGRPGSDRFDISCSIDDKSSRAAASAARWPISGLAILRRGRSENMFLRGAYHMGQYILPLTFVSAESGVKRSSRSKQELRPWRKMVTATVRIDSLSCVYLNVPAISDGVSCLEEDSSGHVWPRSPTPFLTELRIYPVLNGSAELALGDYQ
jgi:hypothetical protein